MMQSLTRPCSRPGQATLCLLARASDGDRLVASFKGRPGGMDDFEELFSRDNLRKTWMSLRRELRQTAARDVIDWTDWALTIEGSLDAIQDAVLSGKYEPRPATRFETGKAKGAYRTITALNVRDALVFRVVCDRALKLAVKKQVPGAYFSRRFSRTPVGKLLGDPPDPSESFFSIWLRYNQYRSRTLLNAPYEVLVVTDISNYFESIQHQLLFEYLAPLGLPRKAVGLLGRLLDALRPRSGHSPTPPVGIPLDELDCSRELAHIFLFEHDHRVVDVHGEGVYVRWMDDQNVGARSYAEARQIVNMMSKSLAEQRLTLNSGKTRFLSPEKVVAHFQLDANEALDDWEKRAGKSKGQLEDRLRAELEELWRKYSRGATAGEGNWDKIVKRFYAMAIRADSSFLESSALEHIIAFPYLPERVFAYFARRNRATQLLRLFKNYLDKGENLYEEVESRFFESLLYLSPSERNCSRIRALSERMAKGQLAGQTGRALGRAAATTALFWFGANEKRLLRLFGSGEASGLPKEVSRAWLTCVFARSPTMFHQAVRRLFGHSSDDVLRLVRFLEELEGGGIHSLGKYKSLKSAWPNRGKYYDGRAWLLLMVASQGGSKKLRDRLVQDFPSFQSRAETPQEVTFASEVRDRLGIANGKSA